MDQTIEQRVSTILCDQFAKAEGEPIDLAADLATTYQCDSLDLCEIAMAIEDEFAINEIPVEQVFDFKTGQEIVNYVRANTPAAA